jgi:ABC-type branched-subunit amino acid transport system permease subunit
MFFFQFALNREAMTWWAFGLSGMERILRGTTSIQWLESFLILTGAITLVIAAALAAFKRTYVFSILQWRGENDLILRVLGIPIHRYTLIMVLITSLCAVTGGNLYAFYYLYIDPRSFWFTMLILVIVIWFLSYNKGEIMTLLIAIMTMFVYEYLRFFKIVDPSQLGYLREALFAIIIMVTSYITFRRISFGRLQ